MGDLYSKRDALQSPETFATVVHAIVLQKYGEDAYEWDPLTVYLEAQADFKADMDPAVTDRWSAIQVIMTTDAFFRRLDAFMGICNTLADGAPFFEMFDPVTVEEAAWGISEVALNRELLPFSYPIRQYLKRILKADGYDPAEYPPVFGEVFELKPSARDVRKQLDGISNGENVDAYLEEQLRDMASQFNQIPTLQHVDDVLARGQFIGTAIGE